MAMTLKEFEAVLKENVELKEKIKEVKKTITPDNMNEKTAVLSQLLKEYGYDVPASEFQLDEINKQALSDDELLAVAGGKYNSNNKTCAASHKALEEGHCRYDYVDTDCWHHDYCDFMFDTDYDKPLA